MVEFGINPGAPAHPVSEPAAERPYVRRQDQVSWKILLTNAVSAAKQSNQSLQSSFLFPLTTIPLKAYGAIVRVFQLSCTNPYHTYSPPMTNGHLPGTTAPFPYRR
jgi:hypothetical protein